MRTWLLQEDMVIVEAMVIAVKAAYVMHFKRGLQLHGKVFEILRDFKPKIFNQFVPFNVVIIHQKQGSTKLPASSF